jgi:Tol biopolymer transport system component
MLMPSVRLIQLTHEIIRQRPTGVSPTGKQIAFVSNRDGPWKICALDVDGANKHD